MIKRAIELARDNPEEKHKHACVIIDKKGNIISEGANTLSKSHPVQAHWAKKARKEKCIWLHAEIHALVKCHETPYALFVARIMRNGNIGMSKPCKICQAAIQTAGVQIVTYTTANGDTESYEL